jgi:transketolase
MIDQLEFDPVKGCFINGDFILSKGHAGLAYYITLFNLGLISDDILESYSENGSSLTGHLTKNDLDGVTFSTGSLGHGLPVAVGLAINSKYYERNNPIFVLISDGECNIGTTWESALIASKLKLDNLILIVDYNKLQSLGSTESTLGLEPIGLKFKSFGFDFYEVDGHNIDSINNTLSILKNDYNGKPKVLLANTIKGKGFNLMENNIEYHYKFLNDEDLEVALKELQNEK